MEDVAREARRAGPTERGLSIPSARSCAAGPSPSRAFRRGTCRPVRVENKPRRARSRSPGPTQETRHDRAVARRHAAAGSAARAGAGRAGPRAPAGLRRPAAAVQRRLPGRGEHPGLARRTPRRAATSRRGASWSPTTRCRRSTGGSATTRARASATAPTSTAPSRSTRSSGSSATSRCERGWAFDPPPARTGKRVLVIGAGPSGLSAAYHLARLGHEVEIRDAGAEPGGMMRYGIPAYRMPRDVLDGELDRIAALGVRMTCDHRVEDLAAERRRGRLRRGLRRGRRAPVQARRHPGPRRRADRRRGVVPAQRRLRRAAGDRAPRRRLRRRQHRHGRRPRGPPARRRRGAHRLPPHPRADAGPRGGGGGRRARGRADQLAAHDHGLRRPGAAGRGHGARRVRLSAADRPVRDARRRHRDPGARARRPRPRSCARCRASSSSATAPCRCRRR